MEGVLILSSPDPFIEKSENSLVRIPLRGTVRRLERHLRSRCDLSAQSPLRSPLGCTSVHYPHREIRI